jgi:hypothetical protein
MTHAIYQRIGPGGAVRQQFAGIDIRGTGPEFQIPTTALTRPPAARDRLKDQTGKWWRVKTVAPSGDCFTLTCDAEGGAA